MSYVDLNTIHDPTTATVAPAAWGDQVRDNLEFLIDPPACSVYASAVQTVATATHAVLAADSENYDNDSMHSTVTNNSRITIQTDGRYLIGVLVEYSAFSTTGTRIWTSLLVNGTTGYDLDIRPNVASASTDNRVNASRTLVLTAGDYIEARANQNSGSDLDVQLIEFLALFQTR